MRSISTIGTDDLKRWVFAAGMMIITMFGSSSWAFQQEQPGRLRDYRYAIIKVPDFGGGSGFAWGMNDLGHIVGQAVDPQTMETHPFFWDGEKTTNLGTFGGNWGLAYDINNHDIVVGSANDFSNYSHAFIWKGQDDIIQLEELGTMGAAAFALNDRNQIVGTATPPPGGPRFYAVIWEGEKIKIINTLGDDISTEGR